ncbi:MAG: hydrolase [Bacillota bacterium]
MQNEKECCPKFDPAPWEGKEITWEGKRFIKGEVCCFMYMPMNYGPAVTKLMKSAEKAGSSNPEYLMLSDQVSKWKMDLYLGTDKEVEGADNQMISGRFLSKVYEGSFREVGKWMADAKKAAEESGRTVLKQYMWYTTCPKCAKKYGKNYVVIFSQIA